MTLQPKPPKPKKCAHCGEKFTPRMGSIGQKACSPSCALAMAPQGREKAVKALARVEGEKHREAKEKLKTRAQHIQDAEKAVRDYRRLYEISIGSGCISCGASQEEIQSAQGWKTGGAFDGGHFLGKGARPELRLTPDNIWLQCKSCNAGSSHYAKKGASVAQGFRDGLIARIGIERVAELEADHAPRKWTIEDLKAITAEYRAKVRELKAKQ